MLRRCLADHHSPIVGRDVAAGETLDLPDDLDGVPLLWPEDYWADDAPTLTVTRED